MDEVREQERPVAWTAMPTGVPVFAADGTTLGTAESVLGDVARDIFHGVVVRRSADGLLVEVLADGVSRITTERVRTELNPAEVGALPVYDGEVGVLEGLIRKVGNRLEST